MGEIYDATALTQPRALAKATATASRAKNAGASRVTHPDASPWLRHRTAHERHAMRRITKATNSARPHRASLMSGGCTLGNSFNPSAGRNLCIDVRAGRDAYLLTELNGN